MVKRLLLGVLGVGALGLAGFVAYGAFAVLQPGYNERATPEDSVLAAQAFFAGLGILLLGLAAYDAFTGIRKGRRPRAARPLVSVLVAFPVLLVWFYLVLLAGSS